MRRLSISLRTLSIIVLPIILALGGCTAGTDGDGDGGTGDGDGDAGDGDGDVMVPCDGTSAEPGIDVGKTGLNFEALEDGDDLPSWPRPQGGIGTRINYNVLGYAEGFSFDGIATNMYLVHDGGGAEGEVGGACGSGCAEGLACYQDTCHVVVSDQVNAMVPQDCASDGTIHIPEMPVRFKNDLTLNDLDGSEVDIHSVFTVGDDEHTDAVRVILQVGDFVFPSWWDEENQPG